jgi:quinol monooxygenase YgiN
MEITKKVVFIAKDECIEELKNLLITMIDASRAEPGCTLYNIYQLKNKPTEFVVVETWENEEYLKGHQETVHYKHYKANFEVYTADKYSDEMSILG